MKGQDLTHKEIASLELSNEVEVTRLLLLWVKWMQPMDEFYLHIRERLLFESGVY